MRPLILLTNDDGIASAHLQALAAALEGHAEVMVVAPERQRSAVSHSITLHKPLRMQQVGEMRYALSGNPVDCVYVGLHRLAPRRPHLVISGMNDGFNLGADVFYSGTVGGAVEGALRGLPAMAVSVEARAPEGAVAAAADFAAALALAILSGGLPERTLLNVNVPSKARRGYRITRLGQRLYDEDVHERVDPRGRSYFWVGGGTARHASVPGSDCEAVDNDLISVTPLHLDLTRADLLLAGKLPAVAGFEPIAPVE
jgi:5'-nucleotidase